MFNMLNKRTAQGTDSPLVCKFLVTLTAFPRSLFPARRSRLYLVERTGLTNRAIQPIGLRIALPNSLAGFC